MDERLVDVTARSDLERRLVQMGKTQAMNTSTIMALRAEISAVKAEKSVNDRTINGDGTDRDVGKREREGRDLEIKCAALEADLAAARHTISQSLDTHAASLTTLLPTAQSRTTELKERMGEEGESVLGGLVADNTLLRHDREELVRVLGEVRRECRVLREENEVLRRASVAGSTDGTVTTPRIATPTTTDGAFPRPLTLNTAASHTRHYSLTPSLASVRSNPPPYSHGRQDSWTTTSPRVRRQDSGAWPTVISEGNEHTRDVSTSSASSGDPQHQQQQQPRRKRLSLTPSFRPPVSPLGGEGYFPATMRAGGMCSVGVQTEVQAEVGEGKEDAGPTLRGLGFEDAASPLTTTQTPISSRTPLSTHSSVHTPLGPTPSTLTPLLSPFAPLVTATADSTTTLLLLIEHTTKLLQRVRQADVPTLTRRLRKQHLAGDVGYLSTSTVKALTRDVAEMRGYFRGVLEEEKRQAAGATTTTTSLIAKKDFMQLVKLFREMLTELVEMRGTVNQVILDPGAVVRMREEVQAAVEGETVEVKRTGQGLGGWIAPTIQKLFTGAEPASSGPTARGPKLEPSTEASTTSVSVEFASTGIIRRSTRAEEDGEPVGRSRSRPAMTLGDGSVRGQGRAGLMGIFAGARPVNGNAQTLRVKPSLEFNTKRPQHRRRISNAVDAVIDQPVPEDSMPPLLERTLRPRGLSDSSIRSTYQSHAMAATARTPGPAPTSGSYWPDSKMVKTLGRRIHAYTTADAREAPSRPAITAAVAVPGTLGAQNRSYMDMLAGTSPIPGHSFSRGEGER